MLSEQAGSGHADRVTARQAASPAAELAHPRDPRRWRLATTALPLPTTSGSPSNTASGGSATPQPGLQRRRRLLFPAPATANPGLHRAVIPKLHALTTWTPRLCKQLLPKYLLALDGTCTAHLYRTLGRLQPPVPGPAPLQAPLTEQVSTAVDARPQARDSAKPTPPDDAAFSQEALSTSAERERAAFELMVRAVGAATAPKLPTFGADGLAAIPGGLAACSVRDERLLHAWAPACTAQLAASAAGSCGGGMRPAQLAELALGLGALGLVPGPAWTTAFCGAATRAVEQGRFGVQQTADLLHGMAEVFRGDRLSVPVPLPAVGQLAGSSERRALSCQGKAPATADGGGDGAGSVQGASSSSSRQQVEDVAVATARAARAELSGTLLQLVRRQLTATLPPSGTHVTAPITWATASLDATSLPPDWLVWYCGYVMAALTSAPGQTQGLLRPQDQCVLLEAVSEVLLLRRRGRGGLHDGGATAADSADGAAASSAGGSAVVLADGAAADAALQRLVSLLVTGLKAAACKGRVPATLMARALAALAQLGPTEGVDAGNGAGFAAAAVSCTLRGMAGLRVCELAAVADALRAWGLRPPAAWVAAALVHSGQRRVLQGSTAAELLPWVQLLPGVVAEGRLPAPWVEAVLREWLRRRRWLAAHAAASAVPYGAQPGGSSLGGASGGDPVIEGFDEEGKRLWTWCVSQADGGLGADAGEGQQLQALLTCLLGMQEAQEALRALARNQPALMQEVVHEGGAAGVAEERGTRVW